MTSPCPACARPLPAGQRLCPACGADALAPTVMHRAPAPAPSGGFPAGQVVAGRYRVVAELGRGGMGEVYRADDLALGVPVALKFLPEAMASSDDRLARFRAEVAQARRVSHPHVCRIHDIGEIDGRPFFSMEFIDGEDLNSLLLRVGRLPEERAVEVARQLCSALAAVHEAGLLHRDLKPANVMLDGRGRVKLTDFGLAALTGEATDVRSGTLLYMAPEQLAGQEVTARSDLFSLGLVLYELFTGKRAFPAASREELERLYAESSPSKPSSHARGIPAEVEDLLLRCLRRDPADRPRSAEEVLAALPGGDPLAQALAAGRTPSPELVAAAGGEGTIPAGVGAALLASFLAGLALYISLADEVMLFRRAPLTTPPDELARQARNLLEKLGHGGPAADRHGNFQVDHDYLRRTMREEASPDRWAGLGSGSPAAVYYFYRQSPQTLMPQDRPGTGYLISPDNPPLTVPGMAGVELDLHGRLLRFYALPPRFDPGDPAAPGAGWWLPLFEAAGLREQDFRRAPPRFSPPGPCDELAGWRGPLPGCPDVEAEVQAGQFRGRPVYFEVLPPWRDRGAATPGTNPHLWRLLVLSAFAGSVLLAARNLRRGRGDTRGAAVLAGFLLTLSLLNWAVFSRHTIDLGEERKQFQDVLGYAVWNALQTATMYLALEPIVRRRWPWKLTSWGRLLQGGYRDPMVGRDVLIGLTAAAVLLLLRAAYVATASRLGAPGAMPAFGAGPFWYLYPGPITPPALLLDTLDSAATTPLVLLMLTCLLHLVVRVGWLAWGLLWAALLFIFAAPLLGPSAWGNAYLVGWAAAAVLVYVVVLERFGLLATAVLIFAGDFLGLLPLTWDLSAWYAARGAAGGLLVAGLGVAAFLSATGKRLLAEA